MISGCILEQFAPNVDQDSPEKWWKKTVPTFPIYTLIKYQIFHKPSKIKQWKKYKTYLHNHFVFYKPCSEIFSYIYKGRKLNNLKSNHEKYNQKTHQYSDGKTND